MMMTLAGFTDPIWQDGWLFWWQVPLIILLIAIIIGYMMYRRRQM
jgi:hypothetical protein